MGFQPCRFAFATASFFVSRPDNSLLLATTTPRLPRDNALPSPTARTLFFLPFTVERDAKSIYSCFGALNFPSWLLQGTRWRKYPPRDRTRRDFRALTDPRLNNRIVVNLISDDEDESRLQPVADRNNFLPTTAASSSRQPSLPVAFNGLPDPAEFPNRANTLRRARVSGMNSLSQYGSAPLGPPRQSSAHPSPRVNGVSKRSEPDYPAIQPAVAYRDENTGIAVSSSRGSNAMNARVKRRKLEIAKPQALSKIGRISSAPILPPVVTNGSGRIAPRMSNATQAILPASTSKPTIITGALRAAASSPRVLADGRGMELPGGMPSAMEPEMKMVLEQQVLPHVHAAVRPYRETLTHAERTEIGRTVSILPQPLKVLFHISIIS